MLHTHLQRHAALIITKMRNLETFKKQSSFEKREAWGSKSTFTCSKFLKGLTKTRNNGGRENSVGIATRYELQGPGIESR